MGDFNADKQLHQLYYPFASQDEWDLASFLLHSNLSMASIDKFLNLGMVSVPSGNIFGAEDSMWSHFHRSKSYICLFAVKDLHSQAEMLPSGPCWKCKPWTTVYPTKNKISLFYQDLLECIQALLYSPLVSDFINFTPLCLFWTAEKLMQIFTEWLSGDAAWEMQVMFFQSN